MAEDLSARVHNALTRLPDWLRRDLSNKDEAIRQRAEDALAAIMVNALTEHEGSRSDRIDDQFQTADRGA